MNKARGQSILEYTLLVMLVIVCVIVMGPYLIRSVGAHFKLWQESISDTVHDRMQKVPIDIPPEKCVCPNTFSEGACGGHLQRENRSCAVNERYMYINCSPPGCGFADGQFSERCDVDTECCQAFIPCTQDSALSACCGKVLAPTPARTYNPTTQPNGLPPLAGTPGIPSSYCHYGEELLFNNCDHSQIRCKPNPDCNARCQGNLPHDIRGIAQATMCPGANTGLTIDLPLTLVGTALNGCTADKCQATCNEGFQPKNVDGLYCTPVGRHPYTVAHISHNTTVNLSRTFCNNEPVHNVHSTGRGCRVGGLTCNRGATCAGGACDAGCSATPSSPHGTYGQACDAILW